MNIIQTINSNAVFIDLMEMDENDYEKYVSVLTDFEIQKLESINHPLKKLEFAASRFLKHHRFENKLINYDETGAPLVDNGPFISLSHTKKHVALAFCDEFRIGVDIETISEKSILTQRRFITEKEKQLFKTSDSHDMTLLWSLKETMYKLSDRNELLFQQHLLIEERNDNNFTGKVLHKSGFITYNLTAFTFPDFFITCNTSTGIAE